MSLLTSKHFDEIIPESLNLFSLPPFQTCVQQHYYENVRPVSQINDEAPLEFSISNTGSDYLDLKRTRLHVKLKVTHNDGSILLSKEHVAPVNLFLQSLFSQVSVYLNDTLVSSTNNHYAYKSMMKALLNFGADAKTTQLTSQLFYKDVGQSNSDIESTDTETGSNTGLMARGQFIKLSQEMTMSGNLFEDVFEMNRYMINGVPMTLKLYRSSPTFCLMSGVANKKFTITLLDAYLKVCRLNVNPALIIAHNTLFENNSNALYPFVKSEVKVTSIPVSQLTHTIDNVSNPIANRYIVAFVDSGSFNGKYDGNPFNFQSGMIKTINLYVNGVSVPGRATSADDADTYLNLFDSQKLWCQNQGNGISRKDFLLGSALFVYQLDEVDVDYLNLVKSGNFKMSKPMILLTRENYQRLMSKQEEKEKTAQQTAHQTALQTAQSQKVNEIVDDDDDSQGIANSEQPADNPVCNKKTELLFQS
ncbi:uncharacterized protein F54H12.2-like [Haliotis asinina]|uniref:uncharacterized protein F54H12.2-like n=1 Tax=Haliotis asinina TaxID=109174 RepID=UPI0035319421